MGLNNCLVAFGGNQGDIMHTFRKARQAIDSLGGCSVMKSSKCYQTLPLGPEGQSDYLNAVVLVETAMAPGKLLEELHAIEDAHGRERSAHWGPRTLDLDMIACNGLVLNTAELALPHPHMHERMFVLRPLCDIAPDWHHPKLGMSAQAMLDKLIADGEKPLTKGEAW
jgi:2-amino-4-hydroxy-6-hydroxymethyldihydropteridine diphosphokinase